MTLQQAQQHIKELKGVIYEYEQYVMGDNVEQVWEWSNLQCLEWNFNVREDITEKGLKLHNELCEFFGYINLIVMRITKQQLNELWDEYQNGEEDIWELFETLLAYAYENELKSLWEQLEQEEKEENVLDIMNELFPNGKFEYKTN